MNTDPNQIQALLETIMAGSPDPIFIKDRESRVLMANPAVLRVWGRPLEAVLGKSDAEIYDDPAVAENVMANDRMVMASGESHVIEETVQAADGMRTYLSTKTPYRNSEGEIIGVIGIAHDITDRIRVEEALRESEGRLRLFIEHAPAALAMFDRQMRYVCVSQRWIQDYGLEGRELIGTSHYEIFPEIPEYWREVHRRSLAGEVIRAEEDRFERADGSVQWQRWEVRPWTDNTGNIAGMVVFTEDITDRKRAEEAAQRSEEKYRRLVETANEGIMQVNRELRVEYVNARMAQMLGYEPEDMIGRIYDDFLHADEHESTNLRFDQRRKGMSDVYECRMMRKDGSRFWALVSASPLHDRNGNWLGSFATFTDINKRKHMEWALRALNETLEQRVAARTSEALKMADQLRALAAELSQTEQRERRRLATILHDHIQQLLVAARMQLEWLEHEPEPDRIRATAQGIKAILKEAIAASRSLTVDLSPPVLHQAGLVGGLSWLASRMLEKNQFTVHLRADSSAEPESEQMRLLLFECVRELLFNSLKHSGATECDVTVMRASNDRIKIVIQDLGKGFDAERVRNRRPDEATFGLFSIEQRLAHLGGHMEIETAPSRGTKVTLTILTGKHAPPIAAEKPAGTRAGIDVRTMEKACRVLIVDDHKIMRDGLRGLLQFEEGIDVVGEAADGPAAIQMAELLAPDVIIMDVNLGTMNGIEATRAIVAKNPQIKVIGLSMHLEQNVSKAMHEAGAVAYLTKGGPSEDLIAAVKACAGKKP